MHKVIMGRPVTQKFYMELEIGGEHWIPNKTASQQSGLTHYYRQKGLNLSQRTDYRLYDGKKWLKCDKAHPDAVRGIVVRREG